MAKKKKKVLNKKQSQKKGDKINNDLIFKAWDLFARETPSVKRGILERKLSAHSSDNKERLLSVYDHVPRSRLRKTIAALRNTINKNNILIDDRFAMMMGASKYSADLVVFDFHNKQRLELNFKMYFFVEMEDEDSITTSLTHWNENTILHTLEHFKEQMFPNILNTKKKYVELYTREAKIKYSDRDENTDYPDRELDFRMGGYVPAHGPHKAGVNTCGKATDDDVPAILTTGEFVMRKEAVRALGAGSNRRGAIILYSLMDQLYELNKKYDYLPEENEEFEDINEMFKEEAV